MIISWSHKQNEAEYDATGYRKVECGVPAHGRTYNMYEPVRRRALPNSTTAEKQGSTHDQHRKSHILKRGRTPPFYFAVDATPKCWTVYDMTGGVPTLLVTHHFGGDYNNDGKWVPIVGHKSTGPDEWPIDEAESFALLQGILIGHARGASLLICANDNQVAGWNYTNGYSKNSVIDRHIIEAKYADGQATLLIADTPCAENYADFGTRMNYVYPSDPLEGSLTYRRKCTWERLLAVQKHWEATAGQYLLREGARKPLEVAEDDACVFQEPTDYGELPEDSSAIV